MTVPGNSAASGAPHRRRGSLLLRNLALILIVVILGSLLIKTFAVRSFYIPSASMASTLMVGDRILVDELTPKILGVHRGDIVVFVDPGGWLGSMQATDGDQYLIKRVIGLPGDQVSCCDATGRLTVDGIPLEEPYLHRPAEQVEASLQPFSITVPADSLWVMGDNRNDSADSRAHLAGPGRGAVPIANVVGKAIIITWPADRWSWLSSQPEAFAQ